MSEILIQGKYSISKQVLEEAQNLQTMFRFEELLVKPLGSPELVIANIFVNLKLAKAEYNLSNNKDSLISDELAGWKIEYAKLLAVQPGFLKISRQLEDIYVNLIRELKESKIYKSKESDPARRDFSFEQVVALMMQGSIIRRVNQFNQPLPEAPSI